jgi:hypothetical protein
MKKENVLKVAHEVVDGILIRTWKIGVLVSLSLWVDYVSEIDYFTALLCFGVSFLVNDVSTLNRKLKKTEDALRDMKLQYKLLKIDVDGEKRSREWNNDSLKSRIRYLEIDTKYLDKIWKIKGWK